MAKQVPDTDKGRDTVYKFHFLNGISEINQLFDDILTIWPAPVCMYACMYVYIYIYIYI